MPEYVWICRSMQVYAYICLNGFYFTFPIVISCLCCTSIVLLSLEMAKNKFKIRLNPILLPSIKILIKCSYVSKDMKRVLLLLRLVVIWHLLFRTHFLPICDVTSWQIFISCYSHMVQSIALIAFNICSICLV